MQPILRLKEEQKAAQERLKVASEELKNAERRKRRLKSQARPLTKYDLLEVIVMRQDARASTAASSSAPAMSDTASNADAR